MKSLFAVLLTLWASAVFARSPAGTAEYEAESKALAMMRQDFGGYLPLDAQMRSNQLSISIPATNARGKRVDFKCLVKKTPLRGGGFRFDVGRPVIAQ